ncbi:HNH endonuclease signature motif containing protein [Amycolatopsis taiwanensis]|uniref:HNH endonuclease signature motif containing protein n=1 Tax=Amycolatopsis taiwanensis TaxID=342230 RepID=UPI00069381D6|nr:HNH endonuclease signature motif containing protein [Amycolatopsis taiwanensis]
MYDLFSLCGDDISRMSDHAAVETMTVAREAICRAQAIQVHAISRLSRIRGHTRWVAEEVALELCAGKQAAAGLVDVAETLTTRLPRLLATMEHGEIDLRTATKVCEVTAALSDEQARAVDERIAGRLAGKDSEKVRRMVRDAVCAIDPDGYAKRAKKRRKDRRLELIHADEGMASLWAYLPAEIASAIYARVDGIARKLKTKDEDRTLDQLRVDVLADLALGKHEGLPGVLAQVYVHVPIDAALGITNTGCELEGHGRIPAEIAREIMADPNSVWRKVTCDPVSGAVLDVGRTRYRPPAALDEFVRVRDRTCRAPGCRRPAQRSDIDHHHDYQRGKNGHTSKTNLNCLCRRHHRLKVRHEALVYRMEVKDLRRLAVAAVG